MAGLKFLACKPLAVVAPTARFVLHSHFGTARLQYDNVTSLELPSHLFLPLVLIACTFSCAAIAALKRCIDFCHPAANAAALAP